MSQWYRAYTRKSRALGDPDDPALLLYHRQDLLRLAEQEGHPLSAGQLFEEIGSGETIADRPVFSSLLELIEGLPAGIGGILYCLSVSRLTRDSHADAGRIIAALSRADVRIHTPGRRYNLRLPEDIFLFDLETVFAHREFQEAKERLARGRQAARRQGRLPNGTEPLGYRYSVEARNLLPDPERFPILVECCRRALTEPVWRLALEYGVPENSLLRALRNPTICGYPARHYGPRDPEKPDRKGYVPIPREQWLWPEQQNTDYPHACTREEWERLQAALDLRRDARPRVHQGDGWCRDRLQFAGDPGPVRLGSYPVSRRQGGNVMCLIYERSRPAGVTRLFVPRQVVHDAVLAALTGFLTDPRLIPWLQALERQNQALERTGGDVERAALTRSITDTRRRYQEAVDAEMDADDANHYHALRERRLRLQDRLKRLEKELQSLEARGDEQQAARALAVVPAGITPEDFHAVWGEMDGDQKRLIVNACFSRIEVTVTPTRPPRPHRREVTDIQWQGWVPR